MGFLIFLGLVSLVIGIFIALEFASIAREKGYDDAKYFWYTFFFGVIGMLMVIALPDRDINYNVVHQVCGARRSPRSTQARQRNTGDAASASRSSVDTSGALG